MRQLGIIDSAFINLEQPNVPQHVGGMGIYDPSTAPGGFVRFKDVLANFEQRLRKLPIFRTRLVEVPFGLSRPYWVLDSNFDMEFHIRHIALPQPGDWRQLCIQAARLHSRPLDMSRPLWEVYIIEGLDSIPDLPRGSFAIYTKMHHSLVDGAGGQSFMSALHDLEPVPPQVDEGSDAEFERADLPTSDLQLLGRSLFQALPRSVSAMSSTAKVTGQLASTVTKALRSELPSWQVYGPKTRFDEPVGPNRVFEAALYDLEDIKALKNAAGTTVNDIAVAIVAGAMRSYLQAHHELPEEALVASMPVNMRTRVGDTGENNQVGAMQSSLHTDIEDPLERLMAIKRGLDDAKAYIDTPLVSVMKLPGVFPPAIGKRLARAYVRNKLTRALPMGQATVITNVAGPNFPLYCAGAQLVRYYPLGVLTPGVGCFHAVFSVAGKVSFGVLADRKQMPDPEFYRQCLDGSFEELCEALLGPAAGRAATRSGRKRATRKKATQSKTTAARGKSAAKRTARKSAEKAARRPASAAAKKKPAAKGRAVTRKKATRKTTSARTAARKKAPASKRKTTARRRVAR